MKKLVLIRNLLIISFSTIIIGKPVQAAQYPSALEGISDVDVSMVLGAGGGPEIPAPGPGFPELPELPIPESPETGFLSLRYISTIDFGESFVLENNQHLFAKQDVNGAFPMVTVQDYRNETIRDGWHLTVKQEEELLNGAQIKMVPSIDPDIAKSLEIKMSPVSELILNSSNQTFATTTNEGTKANPAGIVSMPMGTSSGGVELVIPSYSAAGEYSTKLIWNLIVGPEIEI